MRRLPLPELALFGMTVLWGMSFLSIKWALEDMQPLAQTGFRNLIGLAFILAVRPSALRPTPLEWRAGLLGGSILAMGYIFETEGMTTTNASKSGFLAQFYVALVPFLQAAVFRRWPAWTDLGCLVLATAGIAVMVVHPVHGVSLGEALVASAALAWTVQIVLVGRVAERVDAVRIAAIQLGVMSVVGFGSLAIVDEQPTRWSGALVGHIAFLGIGASALGLLVQAWAQKTVSPTRTAVLFCGQPIFSLAFGVWLMDDEFRVRDGVGAALIMAAVLLTVLVPRNDAARSAAG